MNEVLDIQSDIYLEDVCETITIPNKSCIDDRSCLEDPANPASLINFEYTFDQYWEAKYIADGL